MLLPLPVCVQFHFRQCQNALAPTAVLVCCCVIGCLCCSVAAGWEGQWSQSLETKEQTGSQRTAGCSLPISSALCSFQGLKFCFVIGAQVTSWDGERERASIWVMDVSTTASIPESVLCRAICKDASPGAVETAILHHPQFERFLQIWCRCSLYCKA